MNASRPKTLFLCLALLVVLGVSISTSGYARSPETGEKALTNSEVIALVKADLGDDVVIAKIRDATAESLDVSTDALVTLRKAGVSKPVIQAIMDRVKRRSASPPPSSGGTSAPAPAKPTSSAPEKEQASEVPGPSIPPEEQVEKNFHAEGGYWKGEGKMTEIALPGPQAIPELIDKLVPIIAEGGWEVSNVSREGGVISGSQSISTLSGSGKVMLNVIASKTAEGGRAYD